jgi:glutamate-5-semialdehyde dehydrogenase
MDEAYNIAKAAKLAFQESRLVSASERSAALREIRRELEASKAEIFAANGKDLEVSTQVSSSRAVPFSQQSTGSTGRSRCREDVYLDAKTLGHLPSG